MTPERKKYLAGIGRKEAEAMPVLWIQSDLYSS